MAEKGRRFRGQCGACHNLGKRAFPRYADAHCGNEGGNGLRRLPKKTHHVDVLELIAFGQQWEAGFAKETLFPIIIGNANGLPAGGQLSWHLVPPASTCPSFSWPGICWAYCQKKTPKVARKPFTARANPSISICTTLTECSRHLQQSNNQAHAVAIPFTA